MDQALIEKQIMRSNQAANIRRQQLMQCIKAYGCYLPPSRNLKPTLVLDMDNTLIHTSLTQSESQDFIVQNSNSSKIIPMYVTMRPQLREFLEEVSKLQEIVLFSASIPEQAEQCVEMFDINQLIDQRLQRDACTLSQLVGSKPFQLKDLDNLGRNLQYTLIVDDNMQSFLKHKTIGQQITCFKGEQDDIALFHLSFYLTNLIKQSNQLPHFQVN